MRPTYSGAFSVTGRPGGRKAPMRICGLYAARESEGRDFRLEVGSLDQISAICSKPKWRQPRELEEL
jgi:hypothetical protein